MSTTHLINQAVAEQRHAAEQENSRSMQNRKNSSSSMFGNLHKNVGESERTMSLIAGAVLAGFGLTRGGLTGLAMLGLGGSLAFRGATGHCSMYQAMGMNTAKS